MAIENLLLIANIVIASANILIIYFYYMQLRETRTGVISSKFMDYEKKSEEIQAIVENSPFYFYITNESNKIIKKLKVNAKVVLENKEKQILGKKSFKNLKIDYINPCERIKSHLFRLGEFSKYFPDLFEEHSVNNGKRLFTAPKKKLILKLSLVFKWGGFPNYKQRDYYEIEWESPYELKSKENHPVIKSYNRRNGFYVEKLK